MLRLADGAEGGGAGGCASRPRPEPTPNREQRRPQGRAERGPRGQEEVEKTLGDLLKHMEPWSTTREVKAEVRDTAGGAAPTRRASRRWSSGRACSARSREELTPEEKAELDNAVAAQQKLRERMQQLTDKMRPTRRGARGRRPGDGQELRDALDAAREGRHRPRT